MRIITWNCCRGTYLKNSTLLNSLRPDIAVFQECARPAQESENCLWFGDNPRQGITVQATLPYRLSALPTLPDVPKYVVPVAVSGPIEFTLLAVWTKAKQTHNYVE